MPFSSEVFLARCCWMKLRLLIAAQEAQNPQACPHGYVATILWPSVSLIPCSPPPAATQKTRQSDSSFIEGWRQRRFPIVLSRVENGLINHEAGSRLAWGNDFSDNTNDPNGQSSKERVRVIGAENLLVKSHLLHSLKMFQMRFDSRWSVSSSSALSEFISCSAP